MKKYLGNFSSPSKAVFVSNSFEIKYYNSQSIQCKKLVLKFYFTLILKDLLKNSNEENFLNTLSSFKRIIMHCNH